MSIKLTKVREVNGRRTGFTLIEILIVIAIILIVIGIALPVFIRAKTSAKHTVCINNLKQLGTALAIYAADHDDWLPPHCTDEYYLREWEVTGGSRTIPTGSVTPQRFIDSIFAYTKNSDILFCPEDPSARTTAFEFRVRHDLTSYVYCPKDLDTILTHRLPLRVSLSASNVFHNMLMSDDITTSPSDIERGTELTNHDDDSRHVLRMDLGVERETKEELFPDK